MLARMWTRTRVVEVLGVRTPILQGPFGGGYSTVALAAAVSGAGGLGQFGAMAIPPEGMEELVRSLRAATTKPFSVNLWVPMADEVTAAQVPPERRARTAARLGVADLGDALPPPLPRFEAQIEALLRAKPPVYSFIMGVPDRAIVAAIRQQGGKSLGTASTVEEAVALDEVGVDVVIASGQDAGGHRGAFLRSVEQSIVGTFSLVPQVVDAVRAPVVAAGGIADGRGIAAALALGAEGVQLGTAFLACDESAAPEGHKAMLGTTASRITRLTRVFSGRTARGIENAMMRALEAHPEDVLPYPAQNEMTRELRKKAAKENDVEKLALWAGQAAPLVKRSKAAERLAELEAEVDAVLARLHASR